MSFSWTVEAIHLHPAPDPDIFGKPLFDGEEEYLGVRARIEGNDLTEGEGVGKEKETLPLYRGGKCFLRLPTCLVEPVCLPLTAISGAVRLPIPVLMRIP